MQTRAHAAVMVVPRSQPVILIRHQLGVPQQTGYVHGKHEIQND